ncbi:MAG: 30S ribosomal protein S6 [Patescibacteria group bacterium]|nr:30S ribosomal protein S6 [Patescibacteria group bacterium]
MSKVKKLESAHYELLFIIPNKFTEDEAKAIDAKIKQQITAVGGEVTYAEDWGKKKLAYEIGGYNHGYYKLAEFDLAGEKLAELDNFLRLSNDVLRHQIIRTPKRTAEQIAADRKKSEELAAIRKRLKEGGSEKKELAEEKTAGLVTEEKKAPAVEERKSFKKKTELKDLDAKLDDILDTKDLI